MTRTPFLTHVHVALLALVLASLIPGTTFAQFHISGEASTGFVKANDGPSQYAFNGGLGTFLWRGDVFADYMLADDIFFFSNLQIEQNQQLSINRLSIRMTDVSALGLNLEAGQIDIPFGALGERRFPMQNPFFDLPLMNEHLTSLRKTDYYLSLADPARTIHGDGVRLLERDLYDIGAKVSGSAGMLEYSVALTNGMVSTPESYPSSGLNGKSGYGKIFRLSLTPMQELTIGSSYAFGPYEADKSADTSSRLFGENSGEYQQHIAEGDVNISLGYFTMFAQVINNIWVYDDEQNLNAFGYSVEGRYAVTPRISAAARVGGLHFGTVETVTPTPADVDIPYRGPWDYDVQRYELAASYRVSKDLLVKTVYEINHTDIPTGDPVDNVFVIQAVLKF